MEAGIEIPESVAADDETRDFIGAVATAKMSTMVLAELNQEPPIRSRELSVAVTYLETGVLWLERALAVAGERRKSEQEAGHGQSGSG